MRDPNGKLDLVFRKREDGRTYLAKQLFKLPLQIMRPHYQDDDGTAFLYLLNPSGGILQHDRLLTEVKLERDSRAYITTPGATKYYRMDDGHAEIENRFTVGNGAILEYIPEYNVPFAGSSVRQNNIFDLEADATLIALDIVTAGRVSKGEVFQFDSYSSLNVIYIDGELCVYDRVAVEPSKVDIESLGVMEGHLTNATYYMYSSDVGDELLEKIRKLDTGSVDLATSMVDDHIVIVRMLATDMPDLQRVAYDVWRVFRKVILGKDSVRIRKW